MTRTTIIMAAALALAVTLPAVSAQAQSPRTFVSAAGSDSNPCTFAAPCRHFQAAVNATSLGGEVDALDPAGYGPITISQAITIEGQGWSYIAPPAGGNGITINAVSGNVAIHGVSLNGVGIAGGTTGIQFNSGGSLNVRDCVIRNFSDNDIVLEPSTPINFLIANTIVSENSLAGILYFYNGSSASPSTNGVIDHVAATNNGTGIELDNATTAADTRNFTIFNTVSSNNVGDGLIINVGVASRFIVNIDSSSINNNGNNGINDTGTGNAPIVLLGRSVISGNRLNGIICNSAGTFATYGDNRINWNQPDLSCTLDTTDDKLQ
jgi:hypothetical protein